MHSSLSLSVSLWCWCIVNWAFPKNPFYIHVSQQFYCADAKSCEGLSIFRYNTTTIDIVVVVVGKHWLKHNVAWNWKIALMRVHEQRRRTQFVCTQVTVRFLAAIPTTKTTTAKMRWTKRCIENILSKVRESKKKGKEKTMAKWMIHNRKIDRERNKLLFIIPCTSSIVTNST